jgi:GT2 family glycosyltransferase
MDVSVVIVNWNSKDYLRQCLTSLFQYCRTVDYEVIVVDGASFDGCGEMLAREFPSVTFIQSPENVGFARANNLGARQAGGTHLLLLNPDTLFIENSLGSMMDALKSIPLAAAVGCRLLNADRTLQTSSVLTFPTVFNRMIDSEFLRRRFRSARLWGAAALYSNDAQPSEVEAVSGACLLVKRENFEQVGGFTETYFMYGEDVELCYKLWRAGGKVLHVPTARLVHFGGGSSSQAASNFSTVMMRESWFRFIYAHRGGLAAMGYRIGMGLSALVRLIFIPPLLLFGRHVVRHGKGSLNKWVAVLGWSIGLSPLQRKYS